MRKVRVSVEWVFGDILEYFSFLDFKKDLKVGLSSIAKMYVICAHLCVYGSTTSTFFGIEPPSLDSYFV